MLVVITVDAYTFFTFSDRLVTLRIQEYAFSGRTLLPDSKENKLGSSDAASPSAGKKYRGSFSTMSRMEVCPYSYFWWYGYLRGPGVSFVKTDKFSVGVTNFFSRIGVA